MVHSKGPGMPQSRMRCATIGSSTHSIFHCRFRNISAIYSTVFKRFSTLGFHGRSCKKKILSHEHSRRIGNIPSWVADPADWPHCHDFEGDNCDGLQWSAMVCNASRSLRIAAKCHCIVWPGLFYDSSGISMQEWTKMVHRPS